MTEGPVTGAAGLSPGVPAPTGATDLLWDAENRLVGATVGVSTLSYNYDHLSRLVKRAVTVGGTTTTAHYLYDGWNRIAEWNGTSLSKVYLWGLDLSGTTQGAGGVGGLLSILDVGTSIRYYPTYDGHGNVSEYINSNQSGTAMLAAHFEYDPFGNLTAGTAANVAAFPYRFSTKPQDPVTGLLYYGYRWYDPITGRWTSNDPIMENSGVNLYCFVLNNPVRWADYLGFAPDQSSVSLKLPQEEGGQKDKKCPDEGIKYPGIGTRANSVVLKMGSASIDPNHEFHALPGVSFTCDGPVDAKSGVLGGQVRRIVVFNLST